VVEVVKALHRAVGDLGGEAAVWAGEVAFFQGEVEGGLEVAAALGGEQNAKGEGPRPLALFCPFAHSSRAEASTAAYCKR